MAVEPTTLTTTLIPTTANALIFDSPNTGVCTASPEQPKRRQLYCRLIDKGPTICIYDCGEGIIKTKAPPVPGEENSCPPVQIFEVP